MMVERQDVHNQMGIIHVIVILIEDRLQMFAQRMLSQRMLWQMA